MANYLIQGQTLTDIADAIREKTGTSGAMLPTAMPGFIRGIQTGAADTAGIPEDIVAEAERVASSINSKKASNSITFIAMSDMHEMGDSDHSSSSIISQYRRANLNAGQGAKLIAENVSPDFFANLGDLTWSSLSTTLHDWAQSVVSARGYTAGIEPLTECFFVPGNHDVGYDGGNRDENLVTGMIGSHRYMDFTAKKIRVICMNTADVTDGTDGTERISGEQLQWFANALDLSGKSDTANWGIIVLSHHPLDWGSIKPAANCLAAYLSGTAYSATHDGMAVSKDFSGKNMATFIANFHGHVHCFKVANISGTDALRVAIPNACFGRNNEYGSGGNTEFGETTTYNKSDNGTGKNTAFCAVTIDLDQKIIYADCFGAGYDRIISYGTAEVTTYSVTNDLTNATTSNGAATVLGGAPYSAVITANEGYKLDAVTLTMGGVDITANAYSDGMITITEVTGDIVITVKTVSTVVYDVTNLVVTSQEQDSTAVYNGVGYKDGTYASESGDGTDASCVVTGWIPYAWKPENVIYVRGAKVTTADHVRFFGYKTKTTQDTGAYCKGDNLSDYFSVEELETDTYYKLTPLVDKPDTNYIRISLVGTGENLIITVNEEIVADGGSSGGESGGDGGTTEPGVYTNLVPTAVTTDGSTVFNTTGYKNGAYASAPHTGTDANCVTTGFIWLPSDVSAIYVKGATWDTSNNHCRFHVYGTLGSASGLAYETNATALQYFTVETFGDDYYKFTITTDAVKDHWYCMSLVGTGENLIITHDEPIDV